MAGEPPSGSGDQEKLVLDETKRITSGGQAEVIPGVFTTNDGTEIRVAVKRPKDLENRERFIQEGRVVWRLQQVAELRDRIVPLVLEPEENATQLVFEWMEGGNLWSRHGDLPLSPQDVARIGHYLCDTIWYFSNSVKDSDGKFVTFVHRDISPGNILFTEAKSFDRPRISDFGLVKDKEHPRTVSGERAGTPGYRAPELARNAGMATTTADIYSLSAVMFYLFTGIKEPRSSLAIRKHLKGLSDLDEQGKYLTKLILKGTEPEPNRRGDLKWMSASLSKLATGKIESTLHSPSGGNLVLALIDDLIALPCFNNNRNSDSNLPSSTNLSPREFHQLEMFNHLCWIRDKATATNADLDSVLMTPREDDGRDLLFMAIEAGLVEVVSRLLQEEGYFDVSAVDKSRWTPLHLACSVGNAKIVKILLESGADPKAKTEQNANCFYEAAFSALDNGSELIDMMKNDTPTLDLEAELLNKSNDGFTPALVACWRGNSQTLKYLIDTEIRVIENFQTQDGKDGIDLAVRSGSVECVRILIQKMLDSNAKNAYLADNRQATQIPDGILEEFFASAREGRAWLFENDQAADFKELKYRVNEPSMRYKRTLLHEAASQGHYKIVEILLKHPSIDVLARNNHGRKASDIAPKSRKDIVGLLLEKEIKQRNEARKKSQGSSGSTKKI
jgi:ankyrin repeat protein